MDESEIILSEEDHTYTVDRIVRPSVTGILSDLGFIDFSTVPPDRLALACARGKAVHAAIQFYEEDDLDWFTVHPVIKPFVEAYAQMKEDTGWKATQREQKVFDPVYNYCGQLDGFGSMFKRGLEEVLPDYKSGIKQSAARYQTAGYAGAINKPRAHRCSIHLKNTGKYEILWYDGPKHQQDINGWRAIVSTYHLKHGA